MPLPIDPDQARRDLLWTLSSPSLVATLPHVTALDAIPVEHVISLRKALLANPTPLCEFLAAREIRLLGSYFEALWEYWLRQQPHMELIAQRQQVRDGNSTVGEFDVLVRDGVQGVYLHQELAVKFYLGLPASKEIKSVNDSHWFGPNLRDRLDLKLDKLFHHQLQLARHPVAHAWLRSRGIDTVQPQLLMKGYLFHPLGSSLSLPALIHPHHGRGEWLAIEHIDQLFEAAQVAWLSLEKHSWLAPVECGESKLLTENQLRQRLQAQMQTDPRPHMIAAMAPTRSQAGVWREQARYFVVPSDWQSRAVASLLNESSDRR